MCALSQESHIKAGCIGIGLTLSGGILILAARGNEGGEEGDPWVGGRPRNWVRDRGQPGLEAGGRGTPVAAALATEEEEEVGVVRVVVAEGGQGEGGAASRKDPHTVRSTCQIHARKLGNQFYFFWQNQGIIMCAVSLISLQGPHKCVHGTLPTCGDAVLVLHFGSVSVAVRLGLGRIEVFHGDGVPRAAL